MKKDLLDVYPSLHLFRAALKTSKARVYLVGGALRNYDLGLAGTDLDFAVDQGAIPLARRLARRLKAAFVLLDEEHGSARLVKNIDGIAWTFDLTDWRGKTIQKDLALRDFTVNAMAIDVLGTSLDSSRILDPTGARKDLKSRLVRMVNADVFKDDPLRLLRAFSLSATLGFKIESRTLAQIKKDTPLIVKVASERIREEIFKVLASGRTHGTLTAMDHIGLLQRVVPQISVMRGVHQGGYHHLDVWQHSLEVVLKLEEMMDQMKTEESLKDYLEAIIGGNHTRASLLKMAALLHDIGKPETQRQEEDRMSFHGHEHVGERITRQVAKHLRLSVKERYFLEDAVRMHLRPGYLSNFKKPSAKAVFRYLRDTGPEAVSLAILAMADQAATRGPLTTQAKHKHHAKICRMLIDRYFEVKAQKPKQRLLTGNDLIKVLKLKPSPLFGKILTHVEEAAALGKITTKQEALILAKTIR